MFLVETKQRKVYPDFFLIYSVLCETTDESSNVHQADGYFITLDVILIKSLSGIAEYNLA